MKATGPKSSPISLLLLGFLMQIFSVSADMKSYDGRTSSCETEAYLWRAVVRKSVTVSPLQSAQVPVATIVQCFSHSGDEGQGVMA